MKEQLEPFLSHEVATAKELMECLEGIPSADKFRRIVTLLLQGHYSHPENYGEDYAHLSCYKWSPDAKDSTLAVGFTSNRVGKDADSAPGIYVDFGNVEYPKFGIGNYGGNDESGATTYLTKGANLTLLIYHLTKEPGDAFQLADMTVLVLTAMGMPFAKQSGAKTFEVVGQEKPRKEFPNPDKHYAVAVRVEISYTLRASRSLESHRIRRIANLIDSTT